MSDPDGPEQPDGPTVPSEPVSQPSADASRDDTAQSGGASASDAGGTAEPGRAEPGEPDPGRLEPWPADQTPAPWWRNKVMMRQRLAEQVAAIVDAMAQAGEPVQVAGLDDQPLPPERFGEMAYLLSENRIVVRDSDIPRVSSVLDGLETEPGGIDGITIVRVPNALEVLDRVDTALGKGVARADHVVYVAGDSGSACPAYEALPTTAMAPWPSRSYPHKRCTGAGVRVAVVDTGFDATTAANSHWMDGVTGQQEAVDPANLGRYTGHGTFVAGVLRVMAPEAQVHVYSFLPHGGAILESKIIEKLEEALRDNPDIVSMSAGAKTRHNGGLLCFQVAWERYSCKGTLLISAAGNDASREEFYPAADDYAVGVGALNRKGKRRAGYSNHGPWVDVWAIGSDVVNAFPNGRLVYKEAPMVGFEGSFEHWLAMWSGTSFATPLVAGMVAARMSATGESAPAAWRALHKIARKHRRHGVGPILDPRWACSH